MRPRDAVLAASVALVWGLSFVVVKWGLRDMPPLFFAALRFGAVAVLAPLVPRPRGGVAWLAAYGLAWGALQFGGLFTALALGLPAGVASLVIQSQVLFTTAFAVGLGLERPTARHAVVAGLAIAGLAVVTAARGQSVPLVGLAAATVAAAGWAAANVLVRRLLARGIAVTTPSFVVWASVVPALALGGASLVVEGPSAVATTALHFTFRTAAVLAYQSGAALLFGALAWNHLLARYSPSAVAPFGLLAPLVGVASGWALFGERGGVGIVVGGALLLASVAATLYRGTPAKAGAPASAISTTKSSTARTRGERRSSPCTTSHSSRALGVSAD